MDRMEMVEVLREKSGCSYAEAKAALEESGDDLLEALCWLESHGKTQLAGVSCSTDRQSTAAEEPKKTEKEKKHGPNPVSEGFRSLWEGLVSLLRKCNQTELVMTSKHGKREFGLPLTLFIILLLVAFWIVLAFVVIAIFCGCRFSVENAADQPSDSEEAPQQQKP